MNYLTVVAWEFFLKSFNLSDPKDLRDFCVIVTLYESGARVSELIAVLCGEVRLESPCNIILHGKGRKSRIVPIDPSVASLLRRYIQTRRIPDSSSSSEGRRKKSAGPPIRKDVCFFIGSFVLVRSGPSRRTNSFVQFKFMLDSSRQDSRQQIAVQGCKNQ